MNLVYCALALHSAGKPITEESLKKVSSAVGDVDDAKIKVLVAALEGVNIGEAISKAAMPVAVAAPMVAGTSETAKKEETEEDVSKKAEEAAEGLGALFG